MKAVFFYSLALENLCMSYCSSVFVRHHPGKVRGEAAPEARRALRREQLPRAVQRRDGALLGVAPPPGRMKRTILQGEERKETSNTVSLQGKKGEE